MKRNFSDPTSRRHPFLPAAWFVLVAATVVFTAPPLRAEEVTIRHNGLTLNANLVLAEGKAVPDGVVLLTHALLQHNKMETIRTLQGLFRERGYSTLAITFSAAVDDRRGPYDCATPHRYTVEDNVAEIGLWVDWLKARGAGQIILAAHSSSGNELGYYAIESDEPAITKVLFFAPGTGRFQGIALTDETYFAQYRVKLADVRARARALADAGQGDAMMEGVDFLFCPKANVTASTFLSYYRPRSILRPPVPAFSDRQPKPALVIAGSEDDVAPDLIGVVKPHVDGERLKLVVIEGCGHFFRDLCADDAVDAAVAFLEEKPS